MKIKYIYILLAFSLCQLTFTSLSGQDKREIPIRCLYHFDDLQRKQTWTDSYNAAGLSFVDFNSSSYIEAYFGKNDGSFVKFYDSDNSLNFGVKTSSIKRIKKTTFYGSIDYNNFIGQNMAWSGLIYPERYLINLAGDRPSEKRKESYKLNGGFSSYLTNNLIFGAKINYEAAGYAKMKDLRHLTKLLDFEITGGLIYKLGAVNLGANYYYRKFHENITFSKIADDDVRYQGYLFKGLWFGIFDIWSQDVLNLSRPFIDVIQGGSLQLEFVKESFRFMNEFTYKKQTGLTGPGADRAYSESDGLQYEYRGVAQIEGPKLRHYLRANTVYNEMASYDKVTNQENIGGIYFTYYYGLNKAVEKRRFDLNAEYELAIGAHKCSPDWNFRAGYNYLTQSTVSSLVAPLYNNQDFKVHSYYGKINKNFLFDKSMLDISFLGNLSSGSGTKLRSLLSTSSPSLILDDVVLQSSMDLLNREYEYFVTPKFLGEVGLKYSHFISRKETKGSVYFDAKYSFLKAKEVKYHEGNSYGILSLAVGFSF